MKLAKTITGFNPELVGKFVNVVGIDSEGDPVDIKGFVKQVTNKKIYVTGIAVGYENARASIFDREFYFEEFFFNPAEDSDDPTFYELYIYETSTPIEVDK